MDTKRNQTLEEIEENKIVNEHYQNRVMLIKKALENVTASHSRPLRAYRHQ